MSALSPSAKLEDLRSVGPLPISQFHLIAQWRPEGAGNGLPVTLVGVDGSAGGEAAMRWAVHVAKREPSELIVVHAVRLFSALLRDIPPIGLTPWRGELRRQIVEDWCRPARDAGIPHRAYLTDAAPAAAIRDLASHERAEAIVLGCPSPGVTQRVTGSVAEHVLRHATCPVVAVPASWAPPTSTPGA
jgi:nucleotide-binding universal stress UspA family protein